MELLTSFLNSPLNQSVQDADGMRTSVQFDEKHEVSVVIINFRKLNYNTTSSQQRHMKNKVATDQYDASKWLVKSHFLKDIF